MAVMHPIGWAALYVAVFMSAAFRNWRRSRPSYGLGNEGAKEAENLNAGCQCDSCIAMALRGRT